MQLKPRLFLQYSGQLCGDFILHLSQNALLRFQQRHLGAEILKNLRHFQTDGAATDDYQALRCCRQGPNGIGGEYAAIDQPLIGTWNRWYKRRCTRGNHGTAKTDLLCLTAIPRRRPLERIINIGGAIHRYLVIRDEGGKTLDHLDPHTGIGLQRHLTTGLQHLPTSLFQQRPIETGPVRPCDPQMDIMRTITDAICRGAPCLGRDATAPQAFPTGERRIIDHGHPDTLAGKITGAVLAAGTTTNHHDIVIPVTFGNCRPR